MNSKDKMQELFDDWLYNSGFTKEKINKIKSISKEREIKNQQESPKEKMKRLNQEKWFKETGGNIV